MKKIIKILFFLLLILGIIISLLIFRVERIDMENYAGNSDKDRYLALPMYGNNYRTNSVLGYALGRYYLKGRVVITIVEAYEIL